MLSLNINGTSPRNFCTSISNIFWWCLFFLIVFLFWSFWSFIPKSYINIDCCHTYVYSYFFIFPVWQIVCMPLAIGIFVYSVYSVPLVSNYLVDLSSCTLTFFHWHLIFDLCRNVDGWSTLSYLYGLKIERL